METRNVKEILERMTFEEVVKMLNNHIDNDMQISKYSKLHEMDDEDWWKELSDYYGTYFLINSLLSDMSIFNKNDDYFYYDDDTCAFYSFSDKEEIIDFIGEDNLLEMITLGEDCE